MRINTLKVEGQPSLVRDVASSAIINNNDREFEAYKKRRELQIKQQTQIQTQLEEIECIKKDLHEIKDILKALIKVDR